MQIIKSFIIRIFTAKKSKMKQLIVILMCLLSSAILAQSAEITGVIQDNQGVPIPLVTVQTKYKNTITDDNGIFALDLPVDKEITLTFRHNTFNSFQKTLRLKAGETRSLTIVLQLKTTAIAEVVVRDNRKSAEGIVTVSRDIVKVSPGANSGVESILKTYADVSSNNELSTQYSVRGGNYDENLVYVNGIEVYRPFLVRSGQQEGLSFVNTDLVQNVHFSAGGFQAKYGDKLASVLAIDYIKPKAFGGAVSASLLGGSVALYNKKNKFTYLLGLRYRNNSLLVKNKDIQVNYKPNFTDFQALLTYKFSSKFNVEFLANSALNNYNYQPYARKVNFGSLTNPLALVVRYEGAEKDQFKTYFGALKGNYNYSKHTQFNFTTSVFHSVESEYYDILAYYGLGDVNTNIGSDQLGEVDYVTGIGSQLNHARNDLDALIIKNELKGKYIKNSNTLAWGAYFTTENIRDRQVEWEVIDSAGFAVRPPHHIPNTQPYDAYTAPITPYQNIHAQHNITINRFGGYLQYSKRFFKNANEIWYNLGARFQAWSVQGVTDAITSHGFISPRGQFAIKPDWEKDMLFRFAAGLYHQPPFYRELRDYQGAVHSNVDAQQALHLVLANEYSFDLWERPFKLTTEAYYKRLTSVNPYNVDNVRIRYQATNNAEAYVYGLSTRLNGEFVPGIESWLSFGYMKTEENIANRGYIPRPTDQRLKFAVLFQDYIPNMPEFKMYLNMVYNSGLPGGSPAYTDPYDYQNILPDYFRADIGFSYQIVAENKQFSKGWKSKFKAMSLGVEIYNMFDAQNSITNTWVRDVYSKASYRVPNYMTPRTLNVKLSCSF